MKVTTEFYLRAVSFEQPYLLIEDFGGDAAQIFQKFGIEIDSSNTEFADAKAQFELFEYVATHLDVPDFGLCLAHRISDHWPESGPGILLLTRASNIDMFFKLMVRYSKAHTNGINYQYIDDPNANRVICDFSVHPELPNYRQGSEYVAAAMVKVGRRYIPDFQLKKVCFQHSAPKDLSFHNETFGCPIEFDGPCNQLIVDRCCLNADSLVFGAIAGPVANIYIDRLIAKSPSGPATIASSVRALIPAQLGAGLCSAHSIATQLNISEKKLQRLLSDEGTTFSSILDETRRGVASRLLLHSAISISRLAAFLDYSSDRAFIAAAKRWFGMTPTDFRKSKKVSLSSLQKWPSGRQRFDTHRRSAAGI